MQAQIFVFRKKFEPAALSGCYPGADGVYWGWNSSEREAFFMITVRGIITLLVLAVLFALAVVWISRQGGWKGEGCGGNCSSCHQHCDTPEKKH